MEVAGVLLAATRSLFSPPRGVFASAQRGVPRRPAHRHSRTDSRTSATWHAEAGPHTCPSVAGRSLHEAVEARKKAVLLLKKKKKMMNNMELEYVQTWGQSEKLSCCCCCCCVVEAEVLVGSLVLVVLEEA